MLPGGDSIEDCIAVAQAHRFDRYRIPDNVAQAANRGERVADLVPVIARRHIVGSAHAGEPRGIGHDGSTVLDIECDRSGGRQRLRQGNNRLRQAAGVVDVGGVIVAEPLQRLAIQRDAVPGQR